MSERKSLGLGLAALVLLADEVPLAYLGIQTKSGLDDLIAHPETGFGSIFGLIATGLFFGFLVVVFTAAVVVAVSAIHVASGKQEGLKIGAAAGFLSALVGGYLAYAGVVQDVRPWIAYTLANAVTAIYLALVRLRRNREQKLSSLEFA